MDLNELRIKLEKYFLENKNGENKDMVFNMLKNYIKNDWKRFIEFDEKKYNRNIIFQSNLFEILLICWKPNQKTFIHNHPKNGGFIKILKNNLIENRYLVDKSVKITILKKNEITYINDEIGFHEIFNKSKNNSISLHIYSPGFYKPNEVFIK